MLLIFYFFIFFFPSVKVGNGVYAFVEFEELSSMQNAIQVRAMVYLYTICAHT